MLKQLTIIIALLASPALAHPNDFRDEDGDWHNGDTGEEYPGQDEEEPAPTPAPEPTPEPIVTDSDREPTEPSSPVHYGFCCIHDKMLTFHTAFGRDPAIARQQCIAHKPKAKACSASISMQIEAAK